MKNGIRKAVFGITLSVLAFGSVGCEDKPKPADNKGANSNVTAPAKEGDKAPTR